MKRIIFVSVLIAIAIIFASCEGNDNAGMACYEIEVQISTLSSTEMFYGDETELQAEITSLRDKYKAMGFDEESINIYSTKLNKSKEECTTQSGEIVRTVKPTASFKMTITGINPEGYTGDERSGAEGIIDLPFSYRYVQDGGHTSTSMMEMRNITGGLHYSYTDDSWGSNNYVHDNSYVGGRIICLPGCNAKATEYPTDEDKEFIRYYVKIKFQGYYDDYFTGEAYWYDYTPDGPFQLKKNMPMDF